MHQSSQKGFSLIELMVALSIFSITALLILAAVLNISFVRKRVENEQEGLVAVRTLLDTIGKEVQSGTSFSPGCESGCPAIVSPICPGGCPTIEFDTQVRADTERRRVSYVFDPTANKIYRAEQRTFGSCSGLLPLQAACYTALTPDDMVINNLKFFVHNNTGTNHPLVTIAIDADVGVNPKERSGHKIAASYSPRFTQSTGGIPGADTTSPKITITTPITVAPGNVGAFTYGGSASTMTIAGTAADDDQVVSMAWHNSNLPQGDESGAITITPGPNVFWTLANAPVLLGGPNTFIIKATDPLGNVGETYLTVDATAPPPAPHGNVYPANFTPCGSGIDVHFHFENAMGYYYELRQCKDNPGCTGPDYGRGAVQSTYILGTQSDYVWEENGHWIKHYRTGFYYPSTPGIPQRFWLERINPYTERRSALVNLGTLTPLPSSLEECDDDDDGGDDGGDDDDGGGDGDDDDGDDDGGGGGGSGEL